MLGSTLSLPHRHHHHPTRMGAATPSAPPKPPGLPPRPESVAERAYSLYEAGGRQDGHDVEHWLAAEATLLHLARARDGANRNSN